MPKQTQRMRCRNMGVSIWRRRQAAEQHFADLRTIYNSALVASHNVAVSVLRRPLDLAAGFEDHGSENHDDLESDYAKFPCRMLCFFGHSRDRGRDLGFRRPEVGHHCVLKIRGSVLGRPVIRSP
jgi:hypothetical protein